MRISSLTGHKARRPKTKPAKKKAHFIFKRDFCRRVTAKSYEAQIRFLLALRFICLIVILIYEPEAENLVENLREKIQNSR